MKVSSSSSSPWLIGRRRLAACGPLAVLFLVTGLAPAADTPAPATAPAAAATQPAPAAAADPIGFNGGPTTPLLQPNSYLSGWVSGSNPLALNVVSTGACSRSASSMTSVSAPRAP